MSNNAPPQGNVFSTQAAKELLVAVTGLGMVLFVLAHLGGNFFLFGGAEAFNGYAHKLESLGPLLWMMRIGLIVTFVAHMATSAYLNLANRRARRRYEVQTYVGRKTFATRLMIYTGILVLLFLLLHLSDFTFGDKHGPKSVVEGLNDGESLGLYGLVWNSFGNPLRALAYIVAMGAVGLHLSHAVSSIWVTLGLLTDRATGKAELVAKALGAIVAVSFSSIPAYVLVKTYIIGV